MPGPCHKHPGAHGHAQEHPATHTDMLGYIRENPGKLEYSELVGMALCVGLEWD